jgi:hypothetical protein
MKNSVKELLFNRKKQDIKFDEVGRLGQVRLG